MIRLNHSTKAINIMDKEQKDEIKKKAEELATFLGYNVNSINIDVINVQEAYCQGYAQALEHIKQKQLK